MKNIGVTANVGKPRAAEVLRLLCLSAKKHGLELFGPAETAAIAEGIHEVNGKALFSRIEALLALGGDGTMLRAARELDGTDIPIMGINIGSLGFLTSVHEDNVDRALGCLARNDFTTGIRRMAECRAFRDGREIGGYRALNDVVLQNGPSSRVTGLYMEVDGLPVTQYVCDGLIVSTPTGSTGHSLSAGGPILSPEARVLVVSLICPHTLSSRPLVLPDTSVIAVTVAEAVEEILLTVDGQVGRSLIQGDRVEIRTSDRHVRFMHMPGHSQFSVLRQKLHWSGSNV